MAGKIDHQIIISAVNEILSKAPQGLQYGDLAKQLINRFDGTDIGDWIKPGSGKLNNAISKYISEPNSTVYKPAKGIYRHKQFQENAETTQLPQSPSEKILESAFYQPFADYLVNRLEECTTAIPVGGAALGDKWGTPDVIGVRKPLFDDIIKSEIEIVSAEIKTSGYGLITAFGQACSYKLFSHKSYVVVPANAPLVDIDRLDSLCLIFGIGLILFDSDAPQAPNFQIKTRAAKHDPDMFYVNEKIRSIGDKLLG